MSEIHPSAERATCDGLDDDRALETQLSAYSRRASGRRRGKRSVGEVLGYTAAAGGFAFAGGDAIGATITHVTTGVSFSTSSGTLGALWDIDGGGPDFRFALFGSSSGASNSVSASAATSVASAFALGVSSLALGLPTGFVVGPVPASGSFADYNALLASGTAGNFVSTTAYLGFRFDADFAGAGSFKYGWVKARAENFGNNNEGVRLILSEWAYDANGAPIKVGDTGEVPSPATPLLTLLGLGAMGVSMYRRRRDEGLKRQAAP